MMARMQISLTTEEHKRAKARAASLGVSVAEYIRSLVRRDLADPGSPGDISIIFGLGRSGGSDVAKYKDEYVGEAVEAEYERKTGKRRSAQE